MTTNSQKAPAATPRGVGPLGLGKKPNSFSGFPGVIVTTYRLTNSNGEPLKNEDLKTDNIEVYFTEKGADNGDTDSFLYDITKEEENGFFKAKYLTPETAAKKLHEEADGKHLLFCVHGHNTEASEHMEWITNARASGYFEKSYPVPVTWPLARSDFDLNVEYWENSIQRASAAGEGLQNFVNNINNDLFPRKSLMMHSMGNHVVFNWACKGDKAPDVTFDNIFMVAADVPFDIFHKYPKENYFSNPLKEQLGNKTQKARNLKGMLAPGGKIVVTYTKADTALGVSNPMNLSFNLGDANRLGRVSAGGYYSRRGWPWQWGWKRDDNRMIHSDFKDHIKSHDFTECAKRDGGRARHNYQFSKEMAELYDDPLGFREGNR